MTVPSILIVDDHDAIRHTMARQLTAAGYATRVADSAESAMQLLAHEALEPALVISDLRMPGMSGLDLLPWLRDRLPETDVVLMTAYEDMETALAAIKGGAYDFLVKPLDLDHVEHLVARCLRERGLRRRVRYLSDVAAEPYALRRLVGKDPQMIALSRTIGSLVSNRTPVLIRGETGTGKEVVARTIHFNSPTADEPFVAINCTAIPEPLLESELFGHTRGAFTGATSDRKGRFELAGAGTIFLDEIGDVSASFQAKLLRVLQDGEYYPVGAERARRTGARIMAATHRPLEQLVREGTFREDLYFRLRVVELRIPPLRERRGDIKAIAESLVARIQHDLHKVLVLPVSVIHVLEQYDWPGNVRELENALTRAAVLARAGVIHLDDLSLRANETQASDTSRDVALDTAMYQHVIAVLNSVGGNKRRTARLLQVSRQRLDRILARDVATIRNIDGQESRPLHEEGAPHVDD